MTPFGHRVTPRDPAVPEPAPGHGDTRIPYDSAQRTAGGLHGIVGGFALDASGDVLAAIPYTYTVAPADS
jgi:hypothetical protein